MLLQLSRLNSSLSEIHSSLRSAPQLRNLPSEVDGLKTQVAQLGAQLADLQADKADKEEEDDEDGKKGREERSRRVSSLKNLSKISFKNQPGIEFLQTDDSQPASASSSVFAASAADLSQLWNGSLALRRDVDELRERVNSVGAEIATQLHKGETRAAKSWVSGFLMAFFSQVLLYSR